MFKCQSKVSSVMAGNQCISNALLISVCLWPPTCQNLNLAEILSRSFGFSLPVICSQNSLDLCFTQWMFQSSLTAPKETLKPQRLASVLALHWDYCGRLKPLDFSGFIANKWPLQTLWCTQILTLWIMNRAAISLVKLKRFHCFYSILIYVITPLSWRFCRTSAG